MEACIQWKQYLTEYHMTYVANLFILKAFSAILDLNQVAGLGNNVQWSQRTKRIDAHNNVEGT